MGKCYDKNNFVKDNFRYLTGGRNMPKKQIYLTGFMGTGKSTILNCLHEICGLEKIEMDEQIVREEGMSIPDIFAEKGE